IRISSRVSIITKGNRIQFICNFSSKRGKIVAFQRLYLNSYGNLLFVVPIGNKPKIMFNAHRIYTYKQIIEHFNDLELIEFALIPDYPSSDGIILDATEEMANKCTYGCGCFWFLKKISECK
ncbi:MAG: hypothetical protein AAGU10_14030, partial [Methanosarcina mazei]